MKRYACMPQPVISNGSMSLAAVQPEQIELIRLWRNEQIDILRQTRIISHTDQLAYFERQVWPELQSKTPRQILLAIHENGRFIGYGGLVHLYWEHLRGEVSFLMCTEIMKDPSTVSRLFSQYIILIKQFAFKDLGLRRLNTETYSHREDIIALLESNGFRFEGRMREHVIINGKATDSLIHGCLAHDEV